MDSVRENIGNIGDFIMLSMNNDTKRFCIVPYENDDFLCMIEMSSNNWINIKNINDLKNCLISEKNKN
jgi:hypothetical protein